MTKKDVFIAGAGCVRVGEHWGESLRELAAAAVLKALDSAPEVKPECLYVSNMSSELFARQGSLATLVADQCALGPIPACRVEGACGSGGLGFREAYLAVASGMVENALLVGVEKMTDLLPSAVTGVLSTAADQEYEVFNGATFAGLNAMMMNAYIETFKATTTREQFALFAVNSHRNAVNSPHAQHPKEISVEAVLKSPLVAEPIRVLDCCPVGDGAAAILLTSRESPVRVSGLGCATDTLALGDRASMTELSASRLAAKQAFGMAGVGPKDIDVLEAHDAFTIMGLLALEDLGFVEKGKAGKFVEDGKIGMQGELPTNTFGGLKARGHPVGATGVYQIAELYWQLSGNAGKAQVNGAKWGLAQNIGGLGAVVTATILEGQQ